MDHGPEVVVALGGGAARGLAHVGILRVLQDAGVRIRAVAGTSIGAIVGGALATDKLDEYEQYVRGMDAADLMKLLDVSVSGAGLLRGAKVVDALRSLLGDPQIEDLQLPYVAIAAVLQSGAELRMDSGPLLHAMRASMAIPGVFKPVRHGEDWLVDGGVAMPVPVQAARAICPGLPCIAVNLNNADLVFAGEILDVMDAPDEARRSSRMERVFRHMRRHGTDHPPGMLSSISDVVTHLEYRLTRFQLAADQPELLLEPAVFGLGLFDFHRAAPIIDAGAACARKALAEGALARLRA